MVILLVIAIVIAVFIGHVILSGFEARQRRTIVAAQEAEVAERKKQFAGLIAELEQSLNAEWPARHAAGSSWSRRNYLMMSHDQARLGIMRARWEDGLVVEWDAVIDIAAVVSAEVQQDETTITRLTTTGTTQKGGSLGRAAVGGALFGGAGAIVGATSAGSKTSATTTSVTETRKGSVYLIIGTTDLAQPMHKVLTASRKEGETWLHRIRGAVALMNRSS